MSHARRGWLPIILDLTRVRVTVAVTLTTATGCFLAAGRVNANMWMPVLGVFLLASGASALNQCQDSRIDALMERTRRRPIPAGLIDRSTALFVSILLMLLGLGVLASSEANTSALLLLGGAAVLWYNGLYTYLKRVTAFAVVPGALIGAIPPIIGYMAAGGSLTDQRIMLVAMFFFVWQIPHFWLLLLMCGKQYGDAGLPTLTNVFSPPQLRRITFMWVIATAVAGLAFAAISRGDMALAWRVVLVTASCWLGAKAASLLRPSARDERKPVFGRTFVQVNIYALLVMACLSLNALGIASN